MPSSRLPITPSTVSAASPGVGSAPVRKPSSRFTPKALPWSMKLCALLSSLVIMPVAVSSTVTSTFAAPAEKPLSTLPPAVLASSCSWLCSVFISSMAASRSVFTLSASPGSPASYAAAIRSLRLRILSTTASSFSCVEASTDSATPAACWLRASSTWVPAVWMISRLLSATCCSSACSCS